MTNRHCFVRGTVFGWQAYVQHLRWKRLYLKVCWYRIVCGEDVH